MWLASGVVDVGTGMAFAAQAALSWALLVAATALVVGPVWWWTQRRRAVRTGGDGATRDRTTVAPDVSTEATTEVAAAPRVTRPTLRPLVIGAALFLVYGLLQHTPRVGPFDDLVWNWQGKLLALAAGLLLVGAWSGLAWRDVGLVLPPARAWRSVLLCSVAVVLVVPLLGVDLDDQGRFGETLLFQATLPGLEEELVFRGILWAVIDRALPGRRRLRGVDVGWALVITSLLFGLAHGFTVDAQLAVGFDLAPVVSTGLVGFMLGWLRARWGSILPAIVLHNVINVAFLVAS